MAMSERAARNIDVGPTEQGRKCNPLSSALLFLVARLLKHFICRLRNMGNVPEAQVKGYIVTRELDKWMLPIISHLTPLGALHTYCVALGATG